MPLARHDLFVLFLIVTALVSTHMPLARHDAFKQLDEFMKTVSTHMPLARHDYASKRYFDMVYSFYSHASCEA